MLSLNRKEPIAYYTTGLGLLAAGKVSDGMLMLLGAYDASEEADEDVRFILNSNMLLKRLSLICGGIGLKRHAEGFAELSQLEQPSSAAAKDLISSLRVGLVEAEMTTPA